MANTENLKGGGTTGAPHDKSNVFSVKVSGYKNGETISVQIQTWSSSTGTMDPDQRAVLSLFNKQGKTATPFKLYGDDMGKGALGFNNLSISNSGLLATISFVINSTDVSNEINLTSYLLGDTATSNIYVYPRTSGASVTVQLGSTSKPILSGAEGEFDFIDSSD